MSYTFQQFRQDINSYHRYVAEDVGTNAMDAIHLPPDAHIELCQDIIKTMDDRPMDVRYKVIDDSFQFYQFKATHQIYAAAAGEEHDGPCIWYRAVPVLVAPVAKPTFYNAKRDGRWSPGDRMLTYLNPTHTLRFY